MARLLCGRRVNERALPEFERQELEDLQVVVFAPREVGGDDAADFARVEEAAAYSPSFETHTFWRILTLPGEMTLKRCENSLPCLLKASDTISVFRSDDK